MRCTIPISRSVGTTMKTSQSAASIVTPTSAGRSRLMSVADNIREEEPASHREDDVERQEHGDPFARRRQALAEDGACRLDRPDEERHEQREEKQRKHDLTGAGPDRDRGEQGREGGEADVPEEQDDAEAGEDGQEVEMEEQ